MNEHRQGWCVWAMALALLPACGRTRPDAGTVAVERAECAPPTEDCGLGVCVDLAHDPRSCGACGRACAAGQFCDQGTCVTHCTGDCPCSGAGCQSACEAGKLACYDEASQLGCVDPKNDVDHCGGCHRRCPPGDRCEEGVCCSDELCCPAPLLACAQANGALACTDTAWSDRHCGACDAACAENTTCVQGICEKCSPVQFFLPVAQEVGELDPYGFVQPLVEDVDGDQHLDVVTPTPTGSSLTLTRGDGHGGFGEPERIDTLVSPRAVTAGDFDGDGDQDLAVMGSSGVMIHEANESGSWARYLLPIEGGASDWSFMAVVSADVAGDNSAELVYLVQTANDSRVYVAARESYGVWNTSLLLGASPDKFTRLQVADMNDDGFADLAVWDKTGDILWGNGDGSFRQEHGVIDPLNRYELPLALVDLDGDRHADLLTAEAYGQGTLLYGYYFRTHLAALAGGFEAALPRGVASTGSQRPNVTLADVNGDGNVDLLSREDEVAQVYTFAGVGDGTFTSSATSAVAADKNGFASGDFDEDARIDLVALHLQAQAFTLHLGQGDGSFESPLLALPEKTYLRDAKVYQYPERSVPSIVVVGGLDEGKLRVLELDGALRAVERQQLDIYRPLSLSLNDVDGDEVPDALVPAERALYWAHYGAGGFETPQTLGNVRSATQAISADVVGNGRPTVFAVSNTYPTSLVHVLMQVGAAFEDTSFEVGSAARLALGDVSGDGLPELVVASSEKLQVFQVDRQGAVKELANAIIPWHYPGLELAQLDAGGALAIVIGGGDGYAYGYAAYGFSAGAGLAKLARETEPRLWSIVGIDNANSHVVDIDGDELADFLESKGDGLSVFWRGKGGGRFERSETYRVPGGRELVARTDFDGDGLADMLLKGSSPYAGSLLLVRGALQCR